MEASSGQIQEKFSSQILSRSRKTSSSCRDFHAKESTILKHEGFFVSDIGATGAYHKKTSPSGKAVVEVGPFIQDGMKRPQTLTISAKHAPMAAFISSCLLRLHDCLQKARFEKGSHAPLWMQIWSDRPPNNFDGPYGQLMEVFLGAGRAAGKFTWGGFMEDEGQQVDLLADNLCGMFNDFCSGKRSYNYNGPPITPPVLGAFILEVLT